MKKYNIGIIGCGDISDIYVKNLSNKFDNTNVYALCNRTRKKAEVLAAKYNIEHVMDIDEIIACKDIDAILILTLPNSHYEIAKKCLLAKKHTYLEKPIAFTTEEGEELLAIARDNSILLGCAPDTFLGASLRTARKLIDEGLIGDITAASAFICFRGHEHWHPSPDFLYKKGAGPMLDIGPYYMTALVYLCGEAQAVSGFTSRAFTQRTITSQPLHGQMIDVEVDTHVSGNIRFKNGAIANVAASNDVCHHSLPTLELYGTKGSLKLPDPNWFSGPMYFCPWDENEFKEIKINPEFEAYKENSRGIGLSQLLSTLSTGEAPLASGTLANHVLGIMLAFEKSSTTGTTVTFS